MDGKNAAVQSNPLLSILEWTVKSSGQPVSNLYIFLNYLNINIAFPFLTNLSVSEDIQNLAMIYIEDVQPSTAYQLRVKATTSAGTVVAEYDFVTLDHTGGGSIF